MFARRRVSDSEKRYLAGDSGNANSCSRSVFNLRKAFGPKASDRVVPFLRSIVSIAAYILL